MKTKFDKKTTDAHNAICVQIQKAWRQFAKDRHLDAPHPDWAMVATLVAFDIMAQIAKDRGDIDPLNVLDRIEKEYGGPRPVVRD